MKKNEIKAGDVELTKVLPGGVTEAQVKGWKKEHGDVHVIEVKVDENDTATCYIKEADRNVTAVAMSLYAQNKPLETGEFILNNCWLGGDDRCKTHKKISMAAAVQAKNTVQFLEATVKKL
jgi:hypothetical protein